jgi:methyl-accepting chemotaxis protein
VKTFVTYSVHTVVVVFLVIFPYTTELRTTSALAISLSAGTLSLFLLTLTIRTLNSLRRISTHHTTPLEIAHEDSPSTILPLSSSASSSASSSQITESGDDVKAEEVFGPISTAVKEKVKVIPVLIKQLNAVIDHTEKAAGDLSASFMSINKQAKEQVNQAKDVFGSLSDEQENEESEHVLVHVKKQLDDLVNSFKDVTDINRENQKAIGRVLEHTKSIRKIIRKTAEIADQSKVLSINATIEAARAGEHGKGFSVVAKEFKQLAIDSETSNEEIHGIIDSVEEETDRLYSTTQKGVDACEQLTQSAEAHISETLDRVDSAIADSKSKIQELSDRAEDLAKDISTIVVSIQFQDITRQRIEHVISPLEELAEELNALRTELSNSESLAEFKQKDHKAWLEARYTMEDEKKILDQSMEEIARADTGGDDHEHTGTYS